MLEVGVACLAFFERAPPEGAFGVRSPAKSEHHGQRDLALTKIIAELLAELRRGSPVDECVIDELKRNAMIHVERTEGATLVCVTRSQCLTILAGRGVALRSVVS